MHILVNVWGRVEILQEFSKHLIGQLSYIIGRSITLSSLSLCLHVAIGFSSVIEYYVFFSNIYVIVLTSYKIANQLKRVLDQIKSFSQLQIAKHKISSTELQ